MKLKTLDLVGHRGARGLVTENTLAGFARALAIGVHALELDVHISRDGVVVVHHDPNLNPQTTRDARGRWLDGPSAPIHELSFDELKQYRLCSPRPGSDYARQFPQQQTDTAEPIPNLDLVIDLIQAAGAGQLRLIIEMKLDARTPQQGPAVDTLCDAVVEVLERRGMLQRSCLQSFNWRAILHAQEKHPPISCAFLSVQRQDWNSISSQDGANSPWTGEFQIRDYDQCLPKMIQAAGGRIWAPYYNDLDAENLSIAHDLGLRVVVWTVNETEDMLRHMVLGVDGIITDYPDRLHLLMGEQGYELPASYSLPATH